MPTDVRRTRRPWIAVVLGASVALGACGESEPALERVNAGEAEVTGEGVLVIVVDGLRWDHTSLGGYDRDTTPFLRRFASGAFTFTDTWSPSPSVLGSHVGILSGCDPSVARPPSSSGTGTELGLGSADSWFVPAALPLLGRPFLGAGWNTAAFVDAPMIAGLRGFDRGFRSFVEFGGDAEDEDRAVGVFGVGRRFLQWVNRLELDENWFAYVHMNDLERVWASRDRSPFGRGVMEATADWKPRRELGYYPPVGLDEPRFHSLPPSRASRANPVALSEYELRYDRGIRALDASLARVIGHVDEFDRADDVTIVIVGSFGMGLGESGLFLQAGLVEPEDLHVPLVIRPSRRARERAGLPPGDWKRRARGAIPKGDRVFCHDLSSLIDVAPTIVELAGLQRPETFHGFSLCDAARRAANGTDPVAGGERRRVAFARSAILDGRALITEELQITAYEPEEGIVSDPTDTLRVRSRAETTGAEQDALAAGAYRSAIDRWESLLLQERRWLHFRVGEVDIARMEALRGLQAHGIQ